MRRKTGANARLFADIGLSSYLCREFMQTQRYERKNFSPLRASLCAFVRFVRPSGGDNRRFRAGNGAEVRSFCRQGETCRYI